MLHDDFFMNVVETLQCKLKEDTELKLEEVRLQYDSECKSTEKMTQKKMDALNLEVQHDMYTLVILQL